MSEEAPRRIEVNWVQTLAGALAAVTSAVLLSTVGVAGTLIGAALGSLVLTVGNAVYSYSIDATKKRVAQAQAAAAARMADARRRVRQASHEVEDGVTGANLKLAEADEELEEAQEALEEAADDPTADATNWREVLRGLPWKRIAIAASAIFAVAMLIILTFELVTGRAVSSYTGGSDPDRRTSIPGLGGGGGGAEEQTDESGTGRDGDGTEPGEDDGTGGGAGADSDGSTGTDSGTDSGTDTGTDTGTDSGTDGTGDEPTSAPDTEEQAPAEGTTTPSPATTPTEITTPTQEPLAPQSAPPSP